MKTIEINIEDLTFSVEYSVTIDKGDRITPPYSSIDIESVHIKDYWEDCINITQLLDSLPQLEELLKEEIKKEEDNS